VSVDGFIPTLWAGSILAATRKAQIFTQPGVANRDYEGDIRSAGDRVKIGAIGDVTISSFSKNTDINAPEALTDAQQTLVIDQGKYFNFQLDNVDAAQIRPNLLAEASSRAAYRMVDQEDQFLASLYTDVPSGNTQGSSGSPKTDLGTAGKAYEYIVQAGVDLDETNTPTDGRWAIVPPWFYSKLLLDDRFVKAGTAATDAVLRTGYVGEAAGFSIFKSNNVSNNATTWRVLFGHSMAWSFAEQISQVMAYSPERRFADAVKGLILYGAKVLRPDQLAVLYANAA
jgi:hypothetical protein